MDRRELVAALQTILIQDGPDGHYDGADVIADFVEAAIRGQGREHMVEYVKDIRPSALGHIQHYVDGSVREAWGVPAKRDRS